MIYLNIDIETLTGIKNVLDGISEKIFGTKILTDGVVEEKLLELNLEDEVKINSEFDEYTINRVDKIIKKKYKIKDATYIIAVKYIVPIYSSEENYYEIKNLYLKNKNDKEELKFIRKQLKQLSKKLKCSNLKIKKLTKCTK